jgi:hypothetical protein
VGFPSRISDNDLLTARRSHRRISYRQGYRSRISSSDERSQSMRRRNRLQPPFRSARLDYFVDSEWPFDVLNWQRSPILDDEEAKGKDFGLMC